MGDRWMNAITLEVLLSLIRGLERVCWFWNAYFKNMGMTGVQMGTIRFLLKVTDIVAIPGWGY